MLLQHNGLDLYYSIQTVLKPNSEVFGLIAFVELYCEANKCFFLLVQPSILARSPVTAGFLPCKYTLSVGDYIVSGSVENVGFEGFLSV